ncbi:MAG: alpha-amylase family glycosyl hydrolase [Candidatus Marinimicrobia bacterium]|nr:alpha-amylase family glycosyl hydrolase [Candidatus Neomarinimicrobiota bacterium]
MKKSVFLLCLFTVVVAFAQSPVYSEPPYPTENDSIIIYFDASLGNQGLKDFTGDIYAHTGLITEESESNSDWRYVWTDWPGTNTDKNRLTKISDNLYQLTIGYPHEYYDCPVSEKILRLVFVFRNSTGTKEAKDTGDNDIYLTIFESGLTTVWIEPRINTEFGSSERQPIFYRRDSAEDLHLSAAAAGMDSGTVSMKLFLNDEELHSVSNDTISYDLTNSELQNGSNFVISLSVSGELRDTSETMHIIKYGENTAVRPQGLQDGITVNSPTSFSLSLFAPYKEFVYVIGDFSDWKVAPAFQMKKDSVHADSTWFWITLEDLPENEVAFQYLVDGEIRIADPYSPLILDPWNDPWIPEATYPGLKAYPQGKTDFPAGVVNTDPPEFEWTDGDYRKPGTDELVIYELLVRDWSYARTYQALIDSINYFKRLGITAIELMPVQEFEGNESWGYNPMFHFAPDKYYGPSQKLKELVNLCHMNGIAVIMDVVYNHMTGQSSLVRLYNRDNYGWPTAENPWFNTQDMHPFSVFYDMDHESGVTRRYLDSANRYWIEEFHIDGYRFDLSKGFTQTYYGSDVGAWGSYDAGRVAILKRMADKIWETDSTAYVILEHFSDNSEEAVLSDHGMLLWGNANHNYSEASMGYLGNSDFSWVYHGTRGWDDARVVGYMESHDEERICYKNKEFGNSSGSYNIKYEHIALDRMELVTVFFLSLPGPKMIWQFGELGYDYSIDYNGRTGNKPVKWDYYREADRRDVYDLYSVMNFLRREYPVFRSGSADLYTGNGVAAKRIRLSGSGPNIVILGNFDVTEQEADPAFQHTGLWHEYFRGDTLNVSDVNMSLTLAPGEYRIYSDQKLRESPVAVRNVLPRSFVLRQNHPNPFNSVTNIAYTLTADSRVELSLYDIGGRKVRELVNAYQQAGEYRLQFDAAELSSGVYFYTLRSGRHSDTKKCCI